MCVCIFVTTPNYLTNLPLIVRSLEIQPTVEAYHGLAALLFNSGRMIEAKGTFEQLLRMEPNRVEAVCGYVSIHLFC